MEENEEERDPTESEQFKIAQDYGASIVPKKFPKTLVIAISTHGTIRADKADLNFTVPSGVTLVKVNAVIPSVCNIISSNDMKNASDFITEEINKINKTPVLDTKNETPVLDTKNETPVLDTKDLLVLASEIKDHIVKKVSNSVDQTDTYVRQQRKAGESESLTDELAFLNSFARGYRVIDATGKQMINKYYSRENSDALNPTGDWQIKALNVEGQPDLINEIERANDRRSTRTSDAEITFEELINFCIKKGSRRFLVFDFSCANVADEDRKDVLLTDRDRRNFASAKLKDGTAYGGKTKKIKRKSRKTLKKKLKKARRKKITRCRKISRK
jgi:hypothetical protein